MKTNIFSNKITGIILALVVCALWGSLFPLIKVGYDAFGISGSDIPSVILFAGSRFVICGLILIVMESIRGKKIDIPKHGSHLIIFVAAFLTIILHYSFTYIALAVGDGGKSAIIKQVGFLFLSCFAFLFDKNDRFTIRKMFSAVLGFAGIIVTNLDGTGFSFGLGDFLLILASFCSCIGMVVSKNATKRVSPVQLVAYSQFEGGIFLLICGWIMGGHFEIADIRGMLVFSYICIASIAAYVLWNTLVKYNNLSKLSVIKFTEPLFAVIFSGIILSEDIFKVSYIGAFVIILCSVLVMYGAKECKKNE